MFQKIPQCSRKNMNCACYVSVDTLERQKAETHEDVAEDSTTHSPWSQSRRVCRELVRAPAAASGGRPAGSQESEVAVRKAVLAT